jgi:hypothetical protein
MARVVLFLLVLVFASSAKAQVVTTLTEPTYLAVTTNPTPGGGTCGPPYCVDPQQVFRCHILLQQQAWRISRQRQA